MNQVITDARQVTPHWLTSVLSASGTLTDGQVVDLDCRREDGFHAQHLQLRLKYSKGAKTSVPTGLHLKMAIQVRANTTAKRKSIFIRAWRRK